jgi:hypothetical protein
LTKIAKANVSALASSASYSGLSGTNYANAALPSIDANGAFANAVTSSGTGAFSGWAISSAYTLSGAPPASGSFALTGGTVTIGQSNFVVQWAHPQFGSATAWIDETNWAIKFNFSGTPSTTYSVALPSSKRTPDSFWGKVGLVIAVIALAIAVPALFAAAIGAVEIAGAAAAIGAGTTPIITTDVGLALAGFGASSFALMASGLDLAGCDPYCPTVPGAPPPIISPGPYDLSPSLVQ